MQIQRRKTLFAREVWGHAPTGKLGAQKYHFPDFKCKFTIISAVPDVTRIFMRALQILLRKETPAELKIG